MYCAKQKDTIDLACELNQANIKAIFVHGDLKNSDRKRNIQAWTSRKADVICATKSFGMGIDEKCVRLVIHMTFPESIQDYVQEIGRAGRDGQWSLCTVFFKHEDRSYLLHNIMSIEDENHRLYKYKSMNEAAGFFDNSLT